MQEQDYDYEYTELDKLKKCYADGVLKIDEQDTAATAKKQGLPTVTVSYSIGKNTFKQIKDKKLASALCNLVDYVSKNKDIKNTIFVDRCICYALSYIFENKSKELSKYASVWLLPIKKAVDDKSLKLDKLVDNPPDLTLSYSVGNKTFKKATEQDLAAALYSTVFFVSQNDKISNTAFIENCIVYTMLKYIAAEKYDNRSDSKLGHNTHENSDSYSSARVQTEQRDMQIDDKAVNDKQKNLESAQDEPKKSKSDISVSSADKKSYMLLDELGMLDTKTESALLNAIESKPKVQVQEPQQKQPDAEKDAAISRPMTVAEIASKAVEESFKLFYHDKDEHEAILDKFMQSGCDDYSSNHYWKKQQDIPEMQLNYHYPEIVGTYGINGTYHKDIEYVRVRIYTDYELPCPEDNVLRMNMLRTIAHSACAYDDEETVRLHSYILKNNKGAED